MDVLGRGFPLMAAARPSRRYDLAGSNSPGAAERLHIHRHGQTGVCQYTSGSKSAAKAIVNT